MLIDRRALLRSAAAIPLASVLPQPAGAQGTPQGNSQENPPDEKADYSLRIANGLVEVAPDHIVSTTLYNNQFPGPLLRFKEGQRVLVDIHNDTDTPELVHWHGQIIPSEVDGATEGGHAIHPGTRLHVSFQLRLTGPIIAGV